jgi:hypothetical protein
MFGDDESNILKELSLVECGYRKMSFVVRGKHGREEDCRVNRKVVGFEGGCGGCDFVGCDWVDVVGGCGCGCGCGIEGWLWWLWLDSMGVN